MFVVRFHFTLLPFRLSLLGAPAAGADAVIVLGLDLLLVREVGGVQAASLSVRLFARLRSFLPHTPWAVGPHHYRIVPKLDAAPGLFNGIQTASETALATLPAQFKATLLAINNPNCDVPLPAPANHPTRSAAFFAILPVRPLFTPGFHHEQARHSRWF
jgi:hypothetical protein